jgi:hypothetical protein
MDIASAIETARKAGYNASRSLALSMRCECKSIATAIFKDVSTEQLMGVETILGNTVDVTLPPLDHF